MAVELTLLRELTKAESSQESFFEESNNTIEHVPNFTEMMLYLSQPKSQFLPPQSPSSCKTGNLSDLTIR